MEPIHSPTDCIARLAGRHTGHRDAFAAWKKVLCPLVTVGQKLPPDAPGIANPCSALGIRALDTALRVGSSRAAARVARLVPSGRQPFALPDYPLPVAPR